MKIEIGKKTQTILVLLLLAGVVGAVSEYGNNAIISGYFSGDGGNITGVVHTTDLIIVDGNVTKEYINNTGTDIVHSHDAEATTQSANYVKVKTITITETPDSSLKVYFELKTDTSFNAVFGQIYRNGVVVGTEQVTVTDSYTPFTETIDGWSDGDTLELWIYVFEGTPKTAYAQNFRILGTIKPNNFANS